MTYLHLRRIPKVAAVQEGGADVERGELGKGGWRTKAAGFDVGYLGKMSVLKQERNKETRKKEIGTL
jgi:hypothetical protein